MVLSRAKGPYVWDVEGKRYLDFTAGIAVNALGGGDGGVLKVSYRSSFGYIASLRMTTGEVFLYLNSTNRHTTLI